MAKYKDNNWALTRTELNEVQPTVVVPKSIDSSLVREKIFASLYGLLSALYPIQEVDTQIISALKKGFFLTWPTILPAIIIFSDLIFFEI